MKLVTNKFKSGGLHEKQVVATWNLGTISAFAFRHRENQEKPVSRWPVAGPYIVRSVTSRSLIVYHEFKTDF